MVDGKTVLIKYVSHLIKVKALKFVWNSLGQTSLNTLKQLLGQNISVQIKIESVKIVYQLPGKVNVLILHAKGPLNMIKLCLVTKSKQNILWIGSIVYLCMNKNISFTCTTKLAV